MRIELCVPDSPEVRTKEVVLLPTDSPDPKVAVLAGRLALRYNHFQAQDADGFSGPLRSTVADITISGLLHDIGKLGSCEPLIISLRDIDLRDESDPDRREWKAPLLTAIRNEHTSDGGTILEQLALLYPELQAHRPFLDTVILSHGRGYAENLEAIKWWALDVNVVTLVDDYDALTSAGEERRYRRRRTPEEALAELRQEREKGKYERRLFEIFEKLVLE